MERRIGRMIVYLPTETETAIVSATETVIENEIVNPSPLTVVLEEIASEKEASSILYLLDLYLNILFASFLA